MVSRSIWQRLLDWLQTNPLTGTEPAGDLTDEGLVAQAIGDSVQADTLIAIESARAANTLQLENARAANTLRLQEALAVRQLHMLALRGVIGLIALALFLAAALYVINKAADLKLSIPPIGTGALTMIGGALSTALAWWGRRSYARRRAARTSAGNPPESRAEGDQSPVGTGTP
ncbi:hypothetical protein [Streptomyces phaeochromogenes]|uniref:hypothetical protein n=1 Tax=Streptomyces phaeochromogenes TaxID=1923 RepID=UPI00386B49F9|nr:hypothetical protein OHB08_00670 [Streptomyces phaeochromogenes]